MISQQLEACLQLNRANLAMAHRFDRSLGGYYGLGFNDFVLLFHIDGAPEKRIRRVDLAEKVGLSISGITRALIPLEKIGVVARQSDPRDARIAYAVMTESGTALFENAMRSAEELARDVIPHVTDPKVEEFTKQLKAISGVR